MRNTSWTCSLEPKVYYLTQNGYRSARSRCCAVCPPMRLLETQAGHVTSTIVALSSFSFKHSCSWWCPSSSMTLGLRMGGGAGRTHTGRTGRMGRRQGRHWTHGTHETQEGAQTNYNSIHIVCRCVIPAGHAHWNDTM